MIHCDVLLYTHFPVHSLGRNWLLVFEWIYLCINIGFSWIVPAGSVLSYCLFYFCLSVGTHWLVNVIMILHVWRLQIKGIRKDSHMLTWPQGPKTCSQIQKKTIIVSKKLHLSGEIIWVFQKSSQNFSSLRKSKLRSGIS